MNDIRNCRRESMKSWEMTTVTQKINSMTNTSEMGNCGSGDGQFEEQ
jgi:hypothetical protein